MPTGEDQRVSKMIGKLSYALIFNLQILKKGSVLGGTSSMKISLKKKIQKERSGLERMGCLPKS